MDKRKVMIETLPPLFLCALGGALTGFILGNMSELLEMLPGLIALIPAVIGMRGNISSSMGSRLGSAFHLGLISDSLTSSLVVENLKSSLSLSLYVSLIIPFFYYISAAFLNNPVSGKVLFSLLLITVATGLTAGLLLSFLTFFIILLSIRWGLDPDNVTGPLLTTIGDLLTLLILSTYAVIIGGVI